MGWSPRVVLRQAQDDRSERPGRLPTRRITRLDLRPGGRMPPRQLRPRRIRGNYHAGPEQVDRRQGIRRKRHAHPDQETRTPRVVRLGEGLQHPGQQDSLRHRANHRQLEDVENPAYRLPPTPGKLHRNHIYGRRLTLLQDRMCISLIVDGEKGDVPASLRALLPRLIGFERQIGPFAVAELKLDQALDAHKVEAKDEDFRLYVADTLDNPSRALLPLRASVYSPLANSRLAANRVKTDESVTVVLGNPPYRSKAKALGKWVLEHGRRDSSLLDDFRISGNAKHEYKLHDLAIYFWRWGLWKAFESTPSQPAGVVAFITTRAYLDGPAFAGMRRYLRRYA